MKADAEVKLVVWPTEEPEIPPRPEPAPAAVVPPAATASSASDADPAPMAATADPLPEGIGADSTHAYIWHHAAEAAACLRTLMLDDEGGGDEGPLAGMTARALVAAFLGGLGPEVGSRVVAKLHGQVEASEVARAVSEEKSVRHRTGVAALELVRQRIEAGDYLEDGGPEYAQQLLEGAFGASRARTLLRDPQEASAFHLLKNVAPEQIAPFISHEHPQTIALLLSQIDPNLGSGLLAHLPERMQGDVAYRIATLGNITPAVLAEIGEALEASLGDILHGNQDVGGPKVVADLLNLTGSSVEKNVLDQMDGKDPEVAETVRNLMFTYADINKLTDRELQVLLSEIDQKDLVIALKATEEELKDKILGNMSDKVRQFITEELEFLGPMRLSEVEGVQLRIVQQVRQLEEQGKVTIVRGDADDTFV